MTRGTIWPKMFEFGTGISITFFSYPYSGLTLYISVLKKKSNILKFQIKCKICYKITVLLNLLLNGGRR